MSNASENVSNPDPVYIAVLMLISKENLGSYPNIALYGDTLVIVWIEELYVNIKKGKYLF
jgi:hypothetical protein